MGFRPIVAFTVIVMLALRLRSALSDVRAPQFSVPKEVQNARYREAAELIVGAEEGKTDSSGALDDHFDGPATSKVEEWHTMRKQNGGNQSGHAGSRYHVAAFDFAYVATPFIVSLWVIFASVAKIGVYIMAEQSTAMFSTTSHTRLTYLKNCSGNKMVHER